jgi:hypothetical protein
MVKVAFYKAEGDFSDKAIRVWTRGPYSHVELIINNEMYSSSPRDGKVRSKIHIYNEDVWDYIIIKDADISKMLEFFNQIKGCKYDWAGIAGFISPISDREDKYFCSEFVTKALIIGGVKKLFKIEPAKTSPNRLANLLKD